MDPRAITLAQLEFEEFNQHMRVRGRSRMLDPHERHLAFPEFSMRTLIRMHTSARSWIGTLRVNRVGRLGKQSALRAGESLVSAVRPWTGP